MAPRLRLALDINVALDLLLRRAPFEREAAALFAAASRGLFDGLCASTALTTVYYVVANAHGRARALADVQTLLALFDVAPVTRAALEMALAHRHGDFEDAVLAYAAHQAGATGIVTRDPAGFAEAPLPIYTPTEALALLTTR